MTKQHKATPDDWAQQEDWANRSGFSDNSCIIELRARVEALEAAQQKIRSGPESPLVERVADAIAAQATSAGIVNDRPARVAILEVAAYVRQHNPFFVLDTPVESDVWMAVAELLEQEASRG
jgi:hypothetical protein